MQSLHTLPVTLIGKSTEEKRQEIQSYFNKTCDLYERSFEVLKDDSVFLKKSEPTRHPMIFYFGHTATFFVNKLLLAKVINKRINAEYEALFAIGVDEMSWDDINNPNDQWPSVEGVREYRTQVRALVNELIATLPLTLPITQEDPFWVILMGIEHERIHLETSSVLHRQLNIDDVQPHSVFPRCDVVGPAPKNRLVGINGAALQLGKSKDHPLYGWDNEYGQQAHSVDDFQTSKYLVSNGEFLPFVEAGGYNEPRLWCEEGLKFLAQRQVTCPVFWVKTDSAAYDYRSLTEIIALPLNWPVDVNYLEAKAFCRYKSELDNKPYRLPTEAEWYCLYQQANLEEASNEIYENANINFRHFASSCPVDTFAHGEVFDVIGNAWQWTETPIAGFTDFKVHPVYDDFSTPTFDGKHNLVKGGSWISTGNEIMQHSRYAFRRHFYQHAGFRYVQDNDINNTTDNIYETDALISQYCEFQYGQEYLSVENFAVSCVDLVKTYAKGLTGKALDLGCATGRATFELARHFDHVTGIDFSARFIQVGEELKNNAVIRYQRNEEGAITSIQERTLAALDLEATASKVEFWQGDACNLKSKFTHFDIILATNLIDRLYDPKLFLSHVHERINANGLLVLTSPYTWLEEYTKKENWVGGFTNEQGEEVSTLDGLKALLVPQFTLLNGQDVEFVIRETPRKYQHSIAHMTIWKKR